MRTDLSLDAAIEAVQPFVSRDPARETMNKPFGHRGYVMGIDGHVLAAVRHECAPELTRENQPPTHQFFDLIPKLVWGRHIRMGRSRVPKSLSSPSQEDRP